MKCLVIKPEFVADILDGIKRVEYRTWSTNFRGDFFIACSATRKTKGYIAAVANLTNCVYSQRDKIYKWLLSDIRAVKPIPIKGQLRLFETNINDYEIIVTDDEIDAAYDEAEKWIFK